MEKSELEVGFKKKKKSKTKLSLGLGLILNIKTSKSKRIDQYIAWKPNQKKSEKAILTLDKIDFRTSTIARHKYNFDETWLPEEWRSL